VGRQVVIGSTGAAFRSDILHLDCAVRRTERLTDIFVSRFCILQILFVVLP
jgi:hypothetical protein